ncbi:MAG: ATP-binding cassette domain-containing protein [Planctomycetes bacterium]|nr:ATP-binding cassette domain-containing protein [Planctomycetota bacterium]
MALERVCNKLREEPKIRNKDNAIRLGSFIREIVYKDVSFSYKPNVPVLKKVNLVIHRGQTVAFVGNSGGGKTTMVNLLSRFYDVNEGSISIDGHDVRDIDLHSLRDLIAVVFQDNFLFTGTIRENILCGKLDATQEEIDAAVDAACLREFIDSLELGLETQIGERGIMLSGGQKQRVAIARAFIKHSPIVILDEATSALDNKSEAVVQEAIDNLMQDKTVLVVAHRLSTVVNADVIVVVNHGVIEEMGTHDELVAKQHGIYANLYRNQLILKQEQQQGEAV